MSEQRVEQIKAAIRWAVLSIIWGAFAVLLLLFVAALLTGERVR